MNRRDHRAAFEAKRTAVSEAEAREIRAHHDDEMRTGLDDVLGRYTTDDEADAEDEARELRMLRRDM